MEHQHGDTPATSAEKPVAFKLGNIEVRNKVICAPICGATKIPYRQLARQYGADLCYTEMIKAVALVRKTERSFELAEFMADERPVGAQICGADPETMAEAGRIIEGLGFDTIDINMGCPVRKVVKEGAGAALMRDTSQVHKVVKALADAVSIPVTIKIRSGWTKDSANALEVTRAAEEAGAKMVSIHGRARSQVHQGDIDYSIIANVKQNVSIPVVGNGGIFEPHLAVRMIENTGCDAVMIGRGGYGRPWFFRDVASALANESIEEMPGADELKACVLHHFEGVMRVMGEGKGIRSFRKCASWYFKDLPFGTYFRDMAFRSQTREDLLTVIDAWFDHFAKYLISRSKGETPVMPDIVKNWMKGQKPDWANRASRQLIHACDEYNEQQLAKNVDAERV